MQFPESSEPSSVPTSVGKSLLTFNIPLNNCGLAGLGVAVHGRCSSGRQQSGDMGIYIKSIVHGGAAAQVRDKGVRESWNVVIYRCVCGRGEDLFIQNV